MISVDGGFVLSGREVEGVIENLEIDGQEIVLDKPVFGFGKIEITVNVHSDNAQEVTTKDDGFIFLFMIIIR